MSTYIYLCHLISRLIKTITKPITSRAKRKEKPLALGYINRRYGESAKRERREPEQQARSYGNPHKTKKPRALGVNS